MKLRRAAILLFITFTLAGVTVIHGCAPKPTPSPPISDKLADIVDEYVRQGPDRDDDYRPPDHLMLDQLSAAVSALQRDGPVPEVNGYAVQRLPGQANVRMLAATPPRRKHSAGHGLYMVRSRGENLLIETPHPISDSFTGRLGADLFLKTQAVALLVATAHRNAGDELADVAHAPGSGFDAVSTSLTHKGTVILQLHGFEPDAHPKISEDVVVSTTVTTLSSTGVEHQSPLLSHIADSLHQRGMSVCIASETRCRDLAGRTNLQARTSAARGAEFIHIELAKSLRSTDTARRQVVDALAEAINKAL